MCVLERECVCVCERERECVSDRERAKEREDVRERGTEIEACHGGIIRSPDRSLPERERECVCV